MTKEVDEIAIEQFAGDLAGIEPAQLRQYIQEAQNIVDENEAWLEALHAHARKMGWSAT